MRFGIRECVFIMLLVLLGVGAYWWPWPTPHYGLRTMHERTTELAARTDQMQAKLDQLDMALNQGNISDLGEEIDNLAQVIEVFEQKLPAQREVEVILKQVWEMAAKHKLTPRSVRTDKPVITASYAELPIRMHILGDFDGYYGFLLDLEKLRRITRMPKMSLRKIESKEVEGQMQADVVLSIFFEPSDSDAGAI